MGLRRKGAGVLLANSLVVSLGLANGVVVIRLVGAEGRGTLVLLSTLVAVLATLGQFGFLASSTYYLRKNIYGERTLIANYAIIIVAFSAICGALIVAGSGVLTSVFFEGTTVGSGLMFLAICALPLIMLTNFVAGLLLAKGKARAYSSLTVVPAFAALLLTLVLVAGFDLGVSGALLATVLSQGLAVVMGALLVARRTRGQSVELSPKTMSDLGRFGMRYYGVILGSQIFKRGDIFLLAYFLDVKAVAYYSVGVSLYEVILSLPRAVSTMVTGETAARPEAKAGAFVARVSRGLLWIMLSGALALALLSYWLIPRVYGADFERARVPALILLASAVLLGFSLSLQNYFTGIGRPGVNAMLSFLAGGVNLALSVALIPREGIIGNAVATLIASGLSLGLFLFWFARVADVPVRSTYFPPPVGLLNFARRAPRLQERGG
jgi:O-antigen/teichoic acid export membrane protein